MLLLTADHPELLRPAADIGFGNIDVPLESTAIVWQCVNSPTWWPSETGKFLPTGVIEDLEQFVAAIGDVNEPLRRIARKSYPPSRAPRIWSVFFPGFYPNVLLKVAHLIENLETIPSAVTRVHCCRRDQTR
jgi:hypothetical protein